MPWLEVSRAEDVGGVLSRMTFLVDGSPAAALKRGTTARLEVAAGPHVVQARMDRQRSRPLEVEVTDDLPVSVTGAFTEHSITFTGTFLKPRTALELRASGTP
ncbi:hypothetical protein [Actinoplanes sp. M2I2]|uniref:hypothetical protein n=1 Tax=Actinoplanes sp. M2I2 TaxID=1734444 RepID=UPI002020F183|nr:hypothetical protein [Actinoplanes sp. M2I2]